MGTPFRHIVRMYLFDSLHTAANGLNASQMGIQVAGQNLNNIGTAGYTRSVLQLATATSRKTEGGHIIGNGVQVSGVMQVIDNFLEERLRNATGDAMASATQQKYFTQLESLLNETTEGDLSSSIQAFFNSIDNVLNHPEDVSYRNMAVEQGGKLAKDINGLAVSVVNMQLDINKQINASVDEINRLLKEIEELNTSITLMETKQGSDAIGLRDQRYTAMTELSNYLGIKSSEDPKTGQLTIYSGSNILLSAGYRAEIKLGFQEEMKEGEVIMSQLCIGKEMTPLDVRGGTIYGLYQSHQGIMGGYLEQLTTFTNQLVSGFNEIYSSGQGLTGYTELASLAETNDANIPVAAAGLDSPIVNGGFYIQVYDTKTKTTNPHYIEIKANDPAPTSPFSLKAEPEATGTTFQNLADSINAIEGLSASINSYGQLEIRAEQGNVEFAFAEDTSGILSALGLNTFFTGIQPGSIGVNQSLVSDPSKFAASQSGVGSDTENGVLLAALAITPNPVLGGETLSSRYNSILSEMMMTAGTMKAVASANTLYQDSLQAQRDSISGVNIDEETLMMMTYQRMFQANSRLVTMIDEMMNMLLMI